MCPICLDMLKKTMTTKECLHRFCSDCIITALRSGNKECPTCRKKLVSKRSLRPDPNFDLLIAKIYPSRDEYEAHQERVLAKLNQSNSQVALVNSINEGIKLQSQNRQQRSRKGNENEVGGTVAVPVSTPPTGNGTGNGIPAPPNGSTTTTTATTATTASSTPNGTEPVNRESSSGGSVPEQIRQASSNPPSCRSTPSPVPSNVSYGSKLKRARSVLTNSERSEESEDNSELDSRTEGQDSNFDTEGEGNSELGMNDEIELVFKPHPTEMVGDNPLMKALRENSVRYIKTTANATGKFHVDDRLKILFFTDNFLLTSLS